MSNRCHNKRVCNKDGCTQFHHESLHQAHVSGITFHTECKKGLDPCILLLMSIPVWNSQVKVNVLWDSASTISLITIQKAKELSLTGEKINLTIVKAGGDTEEISSHRYNLNLVDKNQKPLTIVVYGIPKISSNIKSLQIENISHFFQDISPDEIKVLPVKWMS